MADEETTRATQAMRGRPVTNAEAVKAAERLIARAHNGPGEKSTMSIPVQASDDDVLLTDYILEVEAKLALLAAQYAELDTENQALVKDYHSYIDYMQGREAKLFEALNVIKAHFNPPSLTP